MIQPFARVTVRGTVVRKILTAKSLIFAVATENREAKKTDFPRFVAFDHLPDLDKAFSIGDRVTVIAHFRTSKRYPEGTLVPDTVTIEKSRVDAAIDGEEFKPDTNEFVIRGIMASDAYSPTEGTTLATIIVDQDGCQRAYIHTIAFGHSANVLRHRKKDDLIDVIGYVRTKSSRETKGRRNAQSYVVMSASTKTT